jgi:hypothetical protein
MAMFLKCRPWFRSFGSSSASRDVFTSLDWSSFDVSSLVNRDACDALRVSNRKGRAMDLLVDPNHDLHARLFQHVSVILMDRRGNEN